MRVYSCVKVRAQSGTRVKIQTVIKVGAPCASRAPRAVISPLTLEFY